MARRSKKVFANDTRKAMSGTPGTRKKPTRKGSRY